jgi:hypothetical protein
MAGIANRNAVATTNNTGTYVSGSFTPTVGDLLFVICSIGATTDAGAATASANGITFTRIDPPAVRGGIDTTYLFVANQLVPASPSSMIITVDVSADPGTGDTMFTGAVTGVTKVGAAAVRQTAVNNAASGAPAATFAAATLAGNPLVGGMQNLASPAGVTEPSGWTELTDTGYATPTKGGEWAHLAAGSAGVTTVTWGSSSATAWAALIAEFDASASALEFSGWGVPI